MLSLEPLLRARLNTIPGLRGVFGLSDLAAEKSRTQPCIFVIHDGYRVVEHANGGAAAEIATRWIVLVAIKNVSQAADGLPARNEAGTIVNEVLQRLMGWRASSVHQPLMLSNPPRAEYQAGLLWLPISFECHQVMKGLN